jgi:hypothetical protein
MKHSIGIIGSGQLGSRYLQGLSDFLTPSNIWVYDISEESLMLSKQRWEDCKNSTHNVHFVNNIDSLPPEFDFVVVACNADVRYVVTEKVAQKSNVKYWIIEKVLAQTINDIQKFPNLLSNSLGAWVNTPMHIWPLYKELREQYTETVPIHAQFLGIQGLACNAIHYIDYVCRWNQTKIVKVDISELDEQWVESKRRGFYEVLGCLEVFFEDGSYLKMTSSSNEEPDYKVFISVLSDQWNISESMGIAENQNGKTIKAGILYQSTMTSGLIDEIFRTGKCLLPTIEESIHQHYFLLEALTKHWNTNMNSLNIMKLPIT